MQVKIPGFSYAMRYAVFICWAFPLPLCHVHLLFLSCLNVTRVEAGRLQIPRTYRDGKNAGVKMTRWATVGRSSRRLECEDEKRTPCRKRYGILLGV